MNNHPSRRYIFKFSDFNISYEEAKQLLDDAPAGAEFWDASTYGRDFRLATQPTGNYIYTYDTWCKYTQGWTSEGVVSCVPEKDQRYIKMDELRRYFDEYTAGIESIDQKAINMALVQVIQSSCELSAVAVEAMTKGIESTLATLALKQAQTLAALEHLRAIEPGMVVDSEITDLIAMNAQALRIKENQRNAEAKRLFSNN